MAVKIDLKDRRILHELDLNSRAPFSRIGKKIGLSESVVRYRVERLQKLGVIKGFLAFIDVPKIGFHYHNVYLKLKVISESKEKEIIEHLKRMPSVCWLVSTSGHYNLIVWLLVQSIQEFQQSMNEIMRFAENCIVEDSMLIATTACQLPYPLLPNQKRSFSEKHAYISAGKNASLEPVDLKIVQELCVDARISALELSKKVDLSIGSVSEHLDKIFADDLLQGFKTLIDMNKLGKQWYLVLFKLKYIDQETRRAFIEVIKQLPQTFFITNGVGNWSMQVEFYCDNDGEFRSVMNKIFPSQKSDIIKEYTVLRVNHEHKCVFYPIGQAGQAVQTSLGSWCKRKDA